MVIKKEGVECMNNPFLPFAHATVTGSPTSRRPSQTNPSPQRFDSFHSPSQSQSHSPSLRSPNSHIQPFERSPNQLRTQSARFNPSNHTQLQSLSNETPATPPVVPAVARRRPLLKFTPTLKRKKDSFNERDDIKRRETDDFFFEAPRREFGEMLPDDSSDKPDHTSSESLYPGLGISSRNHSPNMPPSSPPLSSDSGSDDDTNINDTITDSEPPFQAKIKPRFVNNRRLMLHENLSSDVDFSIDDFNRFKTSSQSKLPSSSTGEEHIAASSFTRARHHLSEEFEKSSTNIHLENFGLTEIPPEIKDMDHIVVFDQQDTPIMYQLYLTHNNIRELIPPLFEFTKLNVLGLRHNRLEKIPPLISKLVNLSELALGTNRIETFPPQILELPCLRIFGAGPNPLQTHDSTCTPVPVGEDADKDRCLKYVSQTRYHAMEHKRNEIVPSLKNLCLDAIANYDVSFKETLDWKSNTPRVYHNLIATAIIKGRFEERCNECPMIVVEPFAEVIEWWDFLNNREIPFKRDFCSGACVNRYTKRIARLLET